MCKFFMRMILLSIFILFITSLKYEAYGGTYTEDVIKSISNLPKNERQAKLIEGAKKEGKLIIYTSSGEAEAEEREIGFEKKYPYINVETIRGKRGALLERLLTEARAGRHKADIFSIGAIENSVVMTNGLVAVYHSPEEEFIPEEFISKSGFWIANHFNSFHIGYNTNLVSPQDVPKKWEDLLDPKWKGKKIALDLEPTQWFGGMLDYMGEEKGLEFMRKLAAQDIIIQRGHTALAEMLSAGDFPIMAELYGHRIFLLKKRGAPVYFSSPSPVVVSVNSRLIMKNAPHPYSSALFVDWMLSKEAQTILASQGRMPVRRDVKPPFPELYKGVKIQVISPDNFGKERYDYLAKKFREIFLRRR